MDTKTGTAVNFIKLEDVSSREKIDGFYKTFKLNKTKVTSLMENLVHKNADSVFFSMTEKPQFSVTPALVSADNSKKHLYKFFKKIGLYNIVRVTHGAEHFKYYIKNAEGLVFEFVVTKKENPLDALSKALFSYYMFTLSPDCIILTEEQIGVPNENITAVHSSAIEFSEPLFFKSEM